MNDYFQTENSGRTFRSSVICLREDWAVKKLLVCFKLHLSLMSFLCTIHLNRLIAVFKKSKTKAVICENWPK